MSRYTVIPQAAFDELQLDAGVLLRNFDIEAATSGALGFTDEDIICATTGGVNPVCTPSFEDFASDVDNAPVNLKEFKKLTGWNCSISTTGLGTSPALIKMGLGCADIDDSNSSKIVPRRDLSQSDFADLWWVGDKANGGFVAIRVINALSTGGFSLQTSKNGKGQIAMTITGHVSINNQSQVPMEFYSVEPYTGPMVRLNKDFAVIAENETLTLVAETVPSSAVVTWSSDDTSKATVSNGVVTGVEAGTVTITASITQSAQTYTANCVVRITEAE